MKLKVIKDLTVFNDKNTPIKTIETTILDKFVPTMKELGFAGGAVFHIIKDDVGDMLACLGEDVWEYDIRAGEYFKLIALKDMDSEKVYMGLVTQCTEIDCIVVIVDSTGDVLAGFGDNTVGIENQINKATGNSLSVDITGTTLVV